MIKKIAGIVVLSNVFILTIFCSNNDYGITGQPPSSEYLERMNKAMRESESIEKAQVNLMNISAGVTRSFSEGCKACVSVSECNKKFGLNIIPDSWQYEVRCYGKNDFCVQAVRKNDNKKISIRNNQNPTEDGCQR